MFTTLIADRFETAAYNLMEPPPGLEFDYSTPRGEQALTAPDSVSWRVFKNPVSLFIGGVAAVILELAEPSVRTGVWDHSTFRRDAVMRLRRTGAAAMMTVYGPRSAAERMIARVVKMHEKVSGTTPEGVEYHANDPRLLNWVQATASFGFIEAYSRYVSNLSRDEKSRAFAEGAVSSALYGAVGAPKSVSEWEAMLQDTAPSLHSSDILYEFLDIMATADLVPSALRPVQKILIRAAVDLVPTELQRKLGLEDKRLSTPQRLLVCGAAKFADRVPLKSAPPAQASIRMGFDADFLYRR